MTRRTDWRTAGLAELPAGGVLLEAAFAGRDKATPISNPAELARRLQELTGCEGFRIVGNVALCLRWDHNGNEVVVDRIELCGVNA